MSIKTAIEWCDSSANPMMGCNGCELWNPRIKTCYSGILTTKYAGGKGWPESFDKPKIFPVRFDMMVRWPSLVGKDRADKPWLNGLPRIVFLNDMGDTFTEDLPFDWMLPHIKKLANSEHIYMLLTKRPMRMKQFFVSLGYVPDNFRLGVSITSGTTTNRIVELLSIPAKHRFLSIEPLLEQIDIRNYLRMRKADYESPMINQVIVGGESGPRKRPFDADWARVIRDDCKEFGVNFFMKQINKKDPIPPDLLIREFQPQ